MSREGNTVLNATVSKRTLPVLAVLVVFLLGTVPASAHVIYEEVEVWTGPAGNCLEDRAEISDGNGQEGYTKTTAWSWKQLGGVDCIYQWVLPQGRIKVWTELQYWNGSQWVWCSTLAALYNSGSSNVTSQGKYWGPKCTAPDPAYYTTFGYAYIFLLSDNKWHGGVQGCCPQAPYGHYLLAHPN